LPIGNLTGTLLLLDYTNYVNFLDKGSNCNTHTRYKVAKINITECQYDWPKSYSKTGKTG